MSCVVIVSTNDADDIPTSKTHFARLMARRGDDVYYVESLGMRRARFTRRDMSRMVRRIASFTRRNPQSGGSVLDGVKIVSPILVPSPHPRWNHLNSRLLSWQLRRSGANLDDPGSLVLSYLPQLGSLLPESFGGRLAFFMVDDYLEGQHVDAASIEPHMKKMAERAAVIMASSAGIADGFGLRYGRDVSVVQNGADCEHFAARLAEEPEALSHIPRPRIIYAGALENWIDYPALITLARTRRDWSLVLAGPLKVDASELLSESNVHYIGKVDYGILPSILWHCDVGLIPFCATQFTASPEPIKLYEYAAAGVPIVAGSFLANHRCAPHVFVVPEGESYCAAIESALLSGPLTEDTATAILRGARWEDRLAELDSALAGVE